MRVIRIIFACSYSPGFLQLQMRHQTHLWSITANTRFQIVLPSFILLFSTFFFFLAKSKFTLDARKKFRGIIELARDTKRCDTSVTSQRRRPIFSPHTDVIKTQLRVMQRLIYWFCNSCSFRSLIPRTFPIFFSFLRITICLQNLNFSRPHFVSTENVLRLKSKATFLEQNFSNIFKNKFLFKFEIWCLIIATCKGTIIKSKKIKM